MLMMIAIGNVAIALLCIGLTRRLLRFNRQLNQLNRDLNRWTVLLDTSLAQQTLAFTERRTDLRQWQLAHLQWQLQQRHITQILTFLQVALRLRQRRFLWGRR